MLYRKLPGRQGVPVIFSHLPSFLSSYRGARVALLAASALCVTGVQPAIHHAQAAGVLLRLDPSAPSAGGLRDFDTHAVDESELTFETPYGSAKARLYEPRNAGRPPGLVMVHGVHHLGMDEPRLMRFARSMASTGVVVLTPDVRELADYAVDDRSIHTLGAATIVLGRRLPWAPAVGLMGLSFAGGLALLAASDMRYAPSIAYVVAVGAHDDLARVSRFFATGRIEQADGSILEMQPHDYGPLVLVYAHASDFFPPDDVPVAQEALRLWLGDEKSDARKRAEALSGASKTKLDALFDGHIDTIAAELLHDVDAREGAMHAVSPHGNISGLRAPAFLLHGAKDNVIPASETLWIAHDLPPGTQRSVLVSRLIGHVELEGEPTAGERWAAVHFLAGVLGKAHEPQ
jgi:dienelactone hydrolase